MDKEWLEESINGEAQMKFEQKFENIPFDDEKIRQAYQALKKTDEWDNFESLMIDKYAKEITANILHKLEGLQGIIRDAGENNASI